MTTIINTLYRGDSLQILAGLEAASFDALITDPPYSSGGLHIGARQRPASEKYPKAARNSSTTSSKEKTATNARRATG